MKTKNHRVNGIKQTKSNIFYYGTLCVDEKVLGSIFIIFFCKNQAIILKWPDLNPTPLLPSSNVLLGCSILRIQITDSNILNQYHRSQGIIINDNLAKQVGRMLKKG